jgi:hypothetical protein
MSISQIFSKNCLFLIFFIEKIVKILELVSTRGATRGKKCRKFFSQTFFLNMARIVSGSASHQGFAVGPSMERIKTFGAAH